MKQSLEVNISRNSLSEVSSKILRNGGSRFEIIGSVRLVSSMRRNRLVYDLSSMMARTISLVGRVTAVQKLNHCLARCQLVEENQQVGTGTCMKFEPVTNVIFAIDSI